MIGKLTGVVTNQQADGNVILDVGGVGYDVNCPLGTLGKTKRDGAERTSLWIHTHVREDALVLYGFASEEDRAAFRAVVAISGIGPRSAILILSAMDAGELAHAIEGNELARLTSIPGIGKKTAERMVLELKGKLSSLLGGPSRAAKEPVAPRGSIVEVALVNLGYKPAEAARAVAALGDRGMQSDDVGSLVREALRHLQK